MELSRREENLLRALLTRGGRRRSGCCRCEGVRAVGELLLRAPGQIRFILATERGAGGIAAPPGLLRIVGEREFARYSDTVSSQGVIAVAAEPPPASGEVSGPFILALDRLADPGNFGTIVRTWRAIGGRELWLTRGTVDPYSEKSLRAGMGAQFALGIRYFDDLSALCAAAGSAGYVNHFGTYPNRGESCFECADLYHRSVIVIGNEANGIGEAPESLRPVTIPMPGQYESLNAAQAATVFLVEFVRRGGAAHS